MQSVATRSEEQDRDQINLYKLADPHHHQVPATWSRMEVSCDDRAIGIKAIGIDAVSGIDEMNIDPSTEESDLWNKNPLETWNDHGLGTLIGVEESIGVEAKPSRRAEEPSEYRRSFEGDVRWAASKVRDEGTERLVGDLTIWEVGGESDGQVEAGGAVDAEVVGLESDSILGVRAKVRRATRREDEKKTNTMKSKDEERRRAAEEQN
ncbi:UNVERIFIED_CONTAM: hypothetical protein K2H54_062540 [Gekko kuhli]